MRENNKKNCRKNQEDIRVRKPKEDLKKTKAHGQQSPLISLLGLFKIVFICLFLEIGIILTEFSKFEDSSRQMGLKSFELAYHGRRQKLSLSDPSTQFWGLGLPQSGAEEEVLGCPRLLTIWHGFPA